MQGVWVLLGLVIFVIGWLVSGHFLPWTAFQQQWVSAFGVALLALGAVTRSERWQWPLPALPLLALALVPLLQWLFGQIVFLSDAVLPALFVVAFALSIAAAANLADDDSYRWPDHLMTALLCAALASAVLACMQWLRVQLPIHVPLDGLPPGGRPFANLGQVNHLATLLALGIAAGLYLFERRRLGHVATSLILALLGFGLLMTQSRTGWLFLASLALWWIAGRRYLRLRPWPLAVGLSSFALCVWLWAPLNRLLLLAEPVSLSARLNTDLRSVLWRAMIEAVGNSPWIGWGWNQVVFGHLSVALQHDAGQRVFQNAHSVVLDLALWVGIPLAAVVLGAAAYWVYRQSRLCSDGPRWATLLAIAAIGVHALTEYPLDYTYFLLTLGLLVGTVQGQSPIGRPRLAPKATFVVPWAACVGLMGWIAVEYMQVEESARQLRMVLAGVGVDKVPFAPPPDVILLDQPREYHRFWNAVVHPSMASAELDWMRNVVRRNPAAPSAMLRYALAAGLNGREQESAAMLRAICHIHPPARCDEARESWRSAQGAHPSLVAVPGP